MKTNVFALPDWSSAKRACKQIHDHERSTRYRVVCEVSRIHPNVPQDLIIARNHMQELVVIKSVRDHPRVENERTILKRFQHRTPYLRPLIDEINEPSAPVTVVLRYMQVDLLDASVAKTLNRREIKYVSRCVLEALKTLHDDGFVHTGIILS